MTAKMSYNNEWRVAYISDGSTEEVLDNSEEEARRWVDYVNTGNVEGVEPGDVFLQRRRVLTVTHDWESVLD